MAKVTRRVFLKAALGSVLATGSGYWFLTNEMERLIIKQVEIPLKNLPPALIGFKIVQLSDIHLSRLVPLDFIQQVVKTANNLNPDLIVLTGDYVWDDLDAIFDLAPVLGNLNAKYGVFACLGNHDWWTNASLITATLQKAGLSVLINKGLTLQVGKANLYLAGLDDAWSGQPDLKLALDKQPGDALTILLAHEPDKADVYAQLGAISLQLSGHSHGGQIRVPFYGPPLLPYLGQKYDKGLYQVDDMWLYTNPGIGVISVPFRFNCPPEITELILI